MLRFHDWNMFVSFLLAATWRESLLNRLAPCTRGVCLQANATVSPKPSPLLFFHEWQEIRSYLKSRVPTAVICRLVAIQWMREIFSEREYGGIAKVGGGVFYLSPCFYGYCAKCIHCVSLLKWIETVTKYIKQQIDSMLQTWILCMSIMYRIFDSIEIWVNRIDVPTIK